MWSKRRISQALYMIFSLMAFFLMTYLFWAQSIKLNEKYRSDLYTHITRALASGGRGYSLEGKLVVIFDKLFHGSTIGFAAFLSFIVIITPFAVGFFLAAMDCSDKDVKTGSIRNHYIGLWSIFAAPLVIPYIWYRFYKNTMNINTWHNSTSMEMRLFSILAMAFYLRIQSKVNSEGKIRVGDWLLLAASLLISTWFKPSFFIGFAPVMAIWLLHDLLSRRTDIDYIKKIVCLGCSALPAGVMVILQYWKLYGSREDVSISINRDSERTLFVISLGIFLIIPIIVFIYNRKKIAKDYRDGNRAYIQIWMIWFFEIIYHQLLAEVGRSGGNFGWGLKIANYLVMIVSVRLFWQNALQAKQNKLNGMMLRKKDILYLGTIGFLLIWEFGWGIYYFLYLLVGGNYYI